MASTTNILLNIPAHGSFVDSWDIPVNGDFSSLDGFFGGIQAINAAGSSPITLTAPAGTPTPAAGPTQAENAVIRFSGALTANVLVTLPLPGYMIIENLTTGAFVLGFRALASGEVIGIEQGSTQHVYNDGTNVRFVNLQMVGTYLDICDATVPAWITACTKPPFLNCDGTTFSAATYPYLSAKLGGTTLPDLRGVSRSTLNQGTGRITTAGSGLDGNTRFSLGGSQSHTMTLSDLVQHSHAVIDPGHTHPTFVGRDGTANGANSSSMNGSSVGNTGGTTFTPASATTGISINNSGGGNAFGIMNPTTISGITLIRAA